MYLLLHLHDQIKHFGSLANCSMFSFERQFFNFKLYNQGVSSLLQQVSEKVILLKHCKTFVSVCDFDAKDELLRCVSLNTVSENFVFKNSGVILKSGRSFFSEAYNGKKVSCFYEIDVDDISHYVSIIDFFVADGDISQNVDFMNKL